MSVQINLSDEMIHVVFDALHEHRKAKLKTTKHGSWADNTMVDTGDAYELFKDLSKDVLIRSGDL